MRRHKQMTLSLPATLLAVLVSLTPAQAGTTQRDNPVSITYQIGKLVGGSLDTLGTISFTENRSPSLDLNATGETADKLKAAFEDATSQDVLRVRRTKRVIGANGKTVARLIGVQIAKDTPEYPQGLIDYMSSEHGYLAKTAN